MPVLLNVLSVFAILGLGLGGIVAIGCATVVIIHRCINWCGKELGWIEEVGTEELLDRGPCF